MHHIANLTNTIAKLVTEVALSFPVAYINSISLFHNGNKIATCDWKEEHEHVIYMGKLQPAYYIVYGNDGNFSEVEVTGIDSKGDPFKIFSHISKFIKPLAA